MCDVGCVSVMWGVCVCWGRGAGREGERGGGESGSESWLVVGVSG